MIDSIRHITNIDPTIASKPSFSYMKLQVAIDIRISNTDSVISTKIAIFISF